MKLKQFAAPLAPQPQSPMGRRGNSGVTLVETVIALCIAMVVIAGLISGFVQSARQAESSAYFLAAQAMASQGLEQVRAAGWDPLCVTGVVDYVQGTNFPAVVQALDVPGSSGKIVYATNRTTISTISANPPLKMIRVDCVWNFMGVRDYTNSMFTYRAPDQ